MAQTYTDDCYAAAHVVDTDMTNIENNFAALKSSFSGAAAPGNTVAGMFWKDLTKNLLKVRNFNDTAWLGIMQATTSHKILVYRNDAETGWAIDAGSTDRVVVIKGGATYLVGGAEAGSWTLPDYTLLEADIPSHVHPGTVDNDGDHTHTDGLLVSVKGGASSNAVAGDSSAAGNLTVDLDGAHVHTFTTDAIGGDSAHNHGATYRPAAIVCVMQYVNV